MKRVIKANVYTHGKFGKNWRETLDTDNPFLYSGGRYPTKIKAEDLPEYYLPIHSRVIWYMDGYVKMSGIIDMKYKWLGENHLFKDDYLYISYKEPLETKVNSWGSVEYVNYDVCVCGNDIIDMVLAAEKYSGFDTTEVRAGIEEKRIWLRDHEPEYYKEYVGENKDIFTLWKERGYIK